MATYAATDLMAMACGDMSLAYLMRHRDYNLSKTVYASARQGELATFRAYGHGADSPKDYMDALCKMDEDRREKKSVVLSRVGKKV